MGLKIHHRYLTQTPNDNGDFFQYLNDWDIDCNTPINIFENYITDIENYVASKIILLLESENDFKKVIDVGMFSEQEIEKIFVVNLNDNDLNTEIEKYLNENKIEDAENIIKFKTNDIEFKYIPIKYIKEIVKGMYFEEIGYLERSMDDRFYEIFRNNKHWLYGKKEDFELAYNCIGGEYYLNEYGIDFINEIKEDFRRDFIDKYIFGKSLMAINF